MIITRVGTIKEHADGTLDIEYWILDGCNWPPTDTEKQELIAVAKANGTYTKE